MKQHYNLPAFPFCLDCFCLSISDLRMIAYISNVVGRAEVFPEACLPLGFDSMLLSPKCNSLL